MKKYTLYAFLAFFSSLALGGCFVDEWDSSPTFFEGKVTGYRPVYASADELQIKVLGPQSMTETRKLYLYGDHLFINELNRGVHIINFSNPALPIKTGFIKIYGNIDVAVKNGYMYADQAGSLITINIQDLGNIEVVNKLENQLNNFTLYPNEARGQYFECADNSKGVVIGWELTEIVDPKCYK